MSTSVTTNLTRHFTVRLIIRKAIMIAASLAAYYPKFSISSPFKNSPERYGHWRLKLHRLTRHRMMETQQPGMQTQTS